MNFSHVARTVFNQPWAILEDRLAQICAVLEFRMSGGKLSSEEIQARIGTREERLPFLVYESGERTIFAATQAVPMVQAGQAGQQAIAVLPLVGIIQQHANLLSDVSGPGVTATDAFSRRLREAVANPAIKAIVIQVDSPGGGVFGVDELSTEIFKAREQKKIVAVADSMAASAAYWIASAASEFAVTPGGQVGSIGVFAKLTDISKAEEAAGIKTTFISYGKYKAEVDPSLPLTPEAIANLQGMVNTYGEAFTKAVARNRGVTPAAVRSGFGEGRVVAAQQAMDLGMVDRIATFDQVLAKLGVRSAGSTAMAAEEKQAAIAASAVEAELAAAPDPDSITRDIELRRRALQIASL